MGVTTAQIDAEFTAFVEGVEPRLSYALAAAYGVEVGAESTADALGYAWEHWSEVKLMDNPAGYLYRVGQSAARRHRRSGPLFPVVHHGELPQVEPGLPAALSRLSEAQRTAGGVVVRVGVDRTGGRRPAGRGPFDGAAASGSWASEVACLVGGVN